jgi:hypothetical protein
MAFTSTITQRPISMGNKRIAIGTWDGGGASGGDINTGLRSCEFISLTPKGSATVAGVACDETLPCAGSAVTIACGADVDGHWMAIGI